MQNFYDVLLRRFLAVGDAIYRSGDGGENLARKEQLNSLTKTLYKMSQDSPECAGAIWSRRLGILQKALAKRLRDVELMVVSSSTNNDTEEEEEDCYTAWPSMGTILLLRACGHIFPVTDLRHPVVTPALLLLGQTIAQCPVRTVQDVVMGLLCSSIMIEYTKESKRIAPEAISFIAGVIRLFAADGHGALESMPLPTLASSVKHARIDYLRDRLSKCEEYYEDPQMLPRLSLQKLEVRDPLMAASIFTSALRLVKVIFSIYEGSLLNAESETFSELTNALLLINPKCKKFPLPPALAAIVASTASDVARCCKLGQPKVPLRRQAAAATSEVAVVSLAPRMEDLTRYSPGKDKGKHQLQAQRDKIRREYKREHKAVARELRLDAAFIESERRKEKELKDRKAREKRHKNFAWMEQEQATINQQVAQGGALLRGGGIAIARRKAASAKIGIKKGGKLR
jgi:nucleolar protein 14